jgi:hypothetical protein
MPPSTNPLATAHPGAGTSYSVHGTNEIVPNSITEASVGVNALGSAATKLGLIQVASIPLTIAQLKTMYTTAITLLAAPGAGLSYSIFKVNFRLIATSTAITGGGAIVIQYHNSAVAATNTLAATVLTGASAGTSDNIITPINASPAIQNDVIEITNATGVFAGGTLASAIVQIWYSIL